MTEPYFIVDLPTPDEMHKNVSSSHQQEDAKFWKKVFDQIKQSNNPIVSPKTNLYLDRFISLTASATPVASQRDLSESNFNILTFGVRVPRPKKFHLPSSYLAHTIFPKDIRIDTHGQQWINKSMWRPAIDSFSPIEVFPFASALGVANVCPFVPTDADVYSLPSTSKSASLVSTNADIQSQISTSVSVPPGSKQRQLKTVKRKVKKDADFSRKVNSARPNSPPSIANTLLVDCVSLPDIILNIDETERNS